MRRHPRRARRFSVATFCIEVDMRPAASISPETNRPPSFLERPMSSRRTASFSLLERLETRSLMSATVFDQTNLVSDQAGVAQIQDKHLINPWGATFNPDTGAFWISDNDAG